MKLEINEFAGEVEQFLQKMDRKTEAVIKASLYEGAKIVVDRLKEETERLPEDYGYIDRSKPRGKARLSGLVSKQIDGLVDGLGVSKMQKAGGKISLSIGFSGYNDYRTKRYPNGQPNALIARSLVKGTAYLKPNKFVTRAFKDVQREASEKISDEIIERMTRD